MHRIKKRQKRPTVSTTEYSEETGVGFEEESPTITDVTERDSHVESTEFPPPPRGLPIATSQESTGRTWADVANQIWYKERYWYLFVLLLIGISSLVSGNLKTWADGVGVSLLIFVSWIALFFIQKK